MSESTQEPFIAMRDVPAVVRRMTGESQNPHMQTVRRWYTKGCKKITLQVVHVGGMIYTTETMLRTFFDAIADAKATTGASAAEPSDRPESFAQRQRRARQAQARLIKRLGDI